MMTKLTQKPLAKNDKGRQMNRMPNLQRIGREMSQMSALATSRKGGFNLLPLLLAITVCAFMLLAPISPADAATVNYYAAPGTVSNVSGAPTAHTSCASDPSGVYSELLSTSSGDMCTSSYRYTIGSTGVYSKHYVNNAYAGATTVTGTSYQVTMRDGGTVGIQLFYVDSSGNETPFGNEATVTQGDGNTNNYVIDISAQSAVVPAGSKLGLQAYAVAVNPDFRLYLGNPDGRTGNVSGHLIVDEVAGGGGGGDTTAPTVTAFTLPSTSDSPISVTTFTASDNTAVTGYMITESASAPSAGDAGWASTAPTTITATSTGNVTFYAWAKDAAGNVSTSKSAAVDVTGAVGGGLPDIDPAGTYIAAENYTAMGNPAPWQWEEQSGISGYSDTGYLYTISGGTGTVPNGSRTDYPVNFTTGGTYCVWIRAMDASGSGGGDSTFWGFDGSHVGAITQTADNVWAWDSDVQNGSNCATISAGNHTLSLWPREAGQKTDAFVIAMVDANADPTGGGLFTGDNDQSTVIPSGITQIDPSTGGGGGGGPVTGYVQIPDGHVINGNPINPENLYDTDLEPTPRQYRALGGESDGFGGFSVNSKWSVSHVGGDTPSLDPSINNGTLNVTGRGTNIYNTSDYFTYLYQGGKSGDFTIDVEVNSLGSTANYAKAGIMVRQSMANNSRHAMVLLTPAQGAGFYRRLTDGASTQGTRTSGVTAPRWLRMKRTGNLFVGYYSSDGISWTEVANANITMTGTVNVGLAVTSNNSGTDNTANFDNFMFMPGGVSGMSETWTDTSTATPGSIVTTGWTDQDYGIAVRSTGAGVTPETNTFTYSSCVDSSPSTIDIPVSQSVSGSSVSLPSLFNYSGNLSTFTYQIDGAAVNSPWNSLSAFGPGLTGSVNLRVQGIDPDCGGRTISFTQAVTVDNVCSDPDPSTITIRTGQSAGGSNVNLTDLYTTTGDVAGLSYTVNGTPISSPWDSSAYGSSGPESVTLTVTGTDPDCGNHVTALNAIEVDNTCVQNPPSISFDRDVNYVGEGRAIPYKVTIRNEDSPSCTATTFTLGILSDSNLGDFNTSFFNPARSNSGISFNGDNSSGDISLAGRESAVFELAVAAQSGAPEWNSNVTTLELSSNYGGHGTLSGTITTHVSLISPITHSSATTGSTKWGGNWGTSKPGSKYGDFECLTCHDKVGPNIKWTEGNIDTPDGSNWGASGSNSLPITFNDAREGSPDWGDDSDGHTTSVRPCQVCHSATMYHRYDTSGQTDLTHFNNRNCIDCHSHSLGFTASCTGCHGDPPLEATLGGPNGLAKIPAATGSTTPGTHYKHTVVLNFPCEYCHADYRKPGEMPKEINGQQDINHKFDVFGRIASDPDFATASAGHYTGQDGVSYEGIVIQPGQGTMTCENIYCHGGTDNMNGTNPQWNGSITCNNCHGTSATNTPPGYSHTTHVGKMGQACTVCHGDGTNSPLPGENGHVNGSVSWDLTAAPTTGGTATYKGSMSGETNNFAPSSLYSSYGTCSNIACHYGNTTPVWNSGPATCTTCHNNGTNDGALTNSAPPNGNHSDHINPASGTIDERMINAFVNKCESCHGGGANTGKHPGHLGSASAPSPVNPRNYIDFGGMTYNSAYQTCTSLCHEASTPGIWGSTTGLTCDACHKAPYLGPTVVDPGGAGFGMAAAGYGSHLKTTKGETFNTSTDWNSQCLSCHPFHEGGVTVPLPPSNWTAASGTNSPAVGTDMQLKLGLQFPVNGGIHLGGTATSGSNEAEMCWNCHGTDSEINEWGYNFDSNGALPHTKIKDLNNIDAESHNYGQVYQDANWTTLTSAWVDSSGNGYYRKDGYEHSTETTPNYVSSRRISSVHSVNFDLAASTGSSVEMNIDASGNVIRTNSQTLETPEQIRCSYCHDVHDQNRAVLADGMTTETATGRPYLRGNWLGNPYAVDTPPLNSYSYPSTGGPGVGQRFRSGTSTSVIFPSTNAVPRLFSSLDIQSKGGFFIDQNSNRPTAGKNEDLSDTAGICVLCHGNDVDNMDYYTGNSMWRDASGNGHANSALGGSGSGHVNARNIFDGQRGANASTGQYMASQDGVNTSRYGRNISARNSGPYRSVLYRAARNSAAASPPLNTGWYGGNPGDTGRGSQYGTWYNGNTALTNTASIGTNGSSVRAHDFSCSKCHSPHATGLPALLITNCLDSQASNWARTADNNVVVGPTATQGNAQRTPNNCHRNESTSTGWHRLNVAQ